MSDSARDYDEYVPSDSESERASHASSNINSERSQATNQSERSPALSTRSYMPSSRAQPSSRAPPPPLPLPPTTTMIEAAAAAANNANNDDDENNDNNDDDDDDHGVPSAGATITAATPTTNTTTHTPSAPSPSTPHVPSPSISTSSSPAFVPRSPALSAHSAHSQQATASAHQQGASSAQYKQGASSAHYAPNTSELSEFELSLLDISPDDPNPNDYDDDLVSTRTDELYQHTHRNQVMQQGQLNTQTYDEHANFSSNNQHSNNNGDANNNMTDEQREIKEREIMVRGVILDGYKLLSLSHLDLPEHLVQLNLSSQVPPLIDCVAEHMAEFTHMHTLDVSNNYVPFEKLRTLPMLNTLNISCNQISVIHFEPLPNIDYSPDEEQALEHETQHEYDARIHALKSQFHISEIIGFPNLRTLDLSFNLLTQDSIYQLGYIPKLQSLSLESNELFELPPNLSHFLHLKTLNLRGNFFGCGLPQQDPISLTGEFKGEKLPIKRHPLASRGDTGQNTQIEVMVFNSLSTLPNLTDLDLSYNLLTYIPPYLPVSSFTRLYSLHLRHNCIATPSDLLALGDLKCAWVDVRDNPFIHGGKKAKKQQDKEWKDVFPDLYNILVEQCNMNLIMDDVSKSPNNNNQHIMHRTFVPVPSLESSRAPALSASQASNRKSLPKHTSASAAAANSQQQEQYDTYSTTFLTGLTSDEVLQSQAYQQDHVVPDAPTLYVPSKQLKTKKIVNQATCTLKSLLSHTNATLSLSDTTMRYASATASNASQMKKLPHHSIHEQNKNKSSVPEIRQPRIAKVYARMNRVLDDIDAQLSHPPSIDAQLKQSLPTKKHHVNKANVASSKYVDAQHERVINRVRAARKQEKEQEDVAALLQTVTEASKIIADAARKNKQQFV